MNLEPTKIDHLSINGYRYIMWYIEVNKLNRAHRLDGPASMTYDCNGQLVAYSFCIYHPIRGVIHYNEQEYWNLPQVIENKLNKILEDAVIPDQK